MQLEDVYELLLLSQLLVPGKSKSLRLPTYNKEGAVLGCSLRFPGLAVVYTSTQIPVLYSDTL